MKKKIKDLTLEECRKICEGKICDECPLLSKITNSCCLVPQLLVQDLEKEVEVDE